MGIQDKLGKWELFRLVVGQRHCQGMCAGDVPKFEILDEDIDAIYLGVKQMQRCYQDNGPLSQYFGRRFKKIEEAYLKQDRKGFDEGVRDLMVAIDAE